MQQRLAVASVLVLVLLAGMSAVLVVHNAYSQNTPKASTQNQTSHDTSTSTSTSTNSTTTSNGGSLLTTGNQNNTAYGDDGNETEHETETETSINSTLDN